MMPRNSIPLSRLPGFRTGLLRYPGKAISSPDGRLLFVSDSGNHRVVVADAASGQVVDVIGSSEAGFKDGAFSECSLRSPQGVCLVQQRDDRGQVLFVADTENHAVRMADLQTRSLRTVQRGEDMNSPWDLCLGRSPGTMTGNPRVEEEEADTLYVAMAGSHQIWAIALDHSTWWRGQKREKGDCFLVAGSGKEENRNNSYPNKVSSLD